LTETDNLFENKEYCRGIFRLWSTFQPRHQHDAYTRAPLWTITPPAPRGRWRWRPNFCGLFI